MSLHRGHLPGSPARNGLPPRWGYTYKGNNTDQLTGHLGAEALAEWKPDYEQWLPGFARALNSPRTPREGAHRCGYKWNSVNCRTLCGGGR